MTDLTGLERCLGLFDFDDVDACLVLCGQDVANLLHGGVDPGTAHVVCEVTKCLQHELGAHLGLPATGVSRGGGR